MILYIGESGPLTVTIPGSTNTDVVTYEIFYVNGTVLATGTMTFVAASTWRTDDFSPTIAGIVTLVANDTTIDSQRENSYDVRVSSQAAVADGSVVPTIEQMLDNVRIAINAKIVGGAVQSYSINGRNLQNYSLTELMNLEKLLTSRVSATATNGSGSGRTFASFGQP